MTATEAPWRRILQRRSFIEGSALTRAEALLDAGTIRVLCGPFDRLESPWLEPQGIVPQADDGVVIARGTIDGHAVVVASIEQGFQGGGAGEVSGAKVTQALAALVPGATTIGEFGVGAGGVLSYAATPKVGRVINPSGSGLIVEFF